MVPRFLSIWPDRKSLTSTVALTSDSRCFATFAGMAEECRSVAAVVPLDLGLLPFVLGDVLVLLEVLVLDGPPGLAPVEEAEGGAEGRGGPGELDDLAPSDGSSDFLFSHGLIAKTGGGPLSRPAGRD